MKKNAKVNANAVAFVQVEGNAKRVMATRDGENAIFLANALKNANESIYEGLGGVRVAGEKGFFVDFKSAKNAKAFISEAICELSAKAYNKARKTEPKAKVEKKTSVPATAKKSEPAKAKGKKAEVETVTVNGKLYAMTETSDGYVLTPVKAPKTTKGKAKKSNDGFRFERVTDKKGNVKMVDTRADEPAKKATKSAKGKGNAKPTTAPNAKAKKAEPRKTKGNCKVDFSKLAGKGTAANKDAAALMRKAGLTDGTSAEYKAVWAEWCKVR